VVLPKWAPETTTLWVPHSFAFQYRELSEQFKEHVPGIARGSEALPAVVILEDVLQRPVIEGIKQG
jgi:hypothetical protein